MRRKGNMETKVLRSWGDLDLNDLFYAYRKAKADCFYERSIHVTEAFVAYEAELPANLTKLLQKLKAGALYEVLQSGLLRPKIVAKKLNLLENSRKSDRPSPHGYFSDAFREFGRLRDAFDLVPEFRLIGDFSVEAHICSALWINVIGHRFDARMSEATYGSRLRRYRPLGSAERRGAYHVEALGSFEPYFDPYKRWRDNGLKTIKGELENERAVIAVTLDFSSFYHNIDASFLIKPAFLNVIGVKLTKCEIKFTADFVKFINDWSYVGRNRLLELGVHPEEVRTAGIPIGISIVRIISNAVLYELDRSIENDLLPLYYGRYVDDIFLVLRDTKSISSTSDLWTFLCSHVPMLRPEKDDPATLKVSLPKSYEGETRLILQAAKQRCFFLEGRPGLDLLENIASEIRRVSSERRLMPLPEELDQTASARVLSAVSTSVDEADTLRRAEGLTVRRLGWSMQLRSVEILARDLKRAEWAEERKRFYRFAHNHVIRPDRLLDQIDYIPRLLSLAVALVDWHEAWRLLLATLDSVDRLTAATTGSAYKINGIPANGAIPWVWRELVASILAACREAVLRAIRCGGAGRPTARLPKAAVALCERLGLGVDEVDILDRALAIREADWAKVAYKDHLRSGDARRERPSIEGEDSLRAAYPHVADLERFLNETTRSPEGVSPRLGRLDGDPEARSRSLLPFLFPTRAYSSQEVALYLPHECVLGNPDDAARSWAKYVRAVRGVWVRSVLTEPPVYAGGAHGGEGDGGSPPSGPERPVPPLIQIGRSRKSRAVRIGITSFGISDATWSQGANGSPNLSADRYKEIADLVNQAVRMRPRPTHLLLPELALPERWVGTVAGLLQQSGINLIAGLDYVRRGTRRIDSSAVLVLNDDRLGFESPLQIRQRKTFPAPHEEHLLLSDFDITWQDPSTKLMKPVYDHNGFHFGVLICSELQNIVYRTAFQGNVDCLMVLSWNRDLETFSALVDSASLDVHSYVALVNNRQFGDSRVRSPSKYSYKRDVCRVRGGENDHVVVVKIDPEDLRKQQSRMKRWPMPSDQYKPTPEGFAIWKRRRIIPGT